MSTATPTNRISLPHTLVTAAAESSPPSWRSFRFIAEDELLNLGRLLASKTLMTWGALFGLFIRAVPLQAGCPG